MIDKLMKRRVLVARPMSAEAFANFGTVIQPIGNSTTVNAHTAHRYDVDRQPADRAKAGYALVTSIFDTQVRALPLLVKRLERHPYSRQTIMPINGAGHLTIVCQADADGAPDLDTLCAFLCTGPQGIIYRENVWHHPIASIGRAALYLVQSWQNGSESDCEECVIDPVAAILEESTDERV
jgi:ureidoglycolate lyase